jgi:hypothetical protein
VRDLARATLPNAEGVVASPRPDGPLLDPWPDASMMASIKNPGGNVMAQ